MTKKQRETLYKIIINEYLDTPNHLKNIKSLSRKYGMSPTTISKVFKQNGIEIYNTSHHTVINEKVFDEIDTEEKAYWLGFMYADGCIYSKENRIELSLQDSDIEHLRKFAKFLESPKENLVKLYEKGGHRKYGSCRVSFRSSHMWEALNSKGCTPRKSLTLIFPDDSIFSSVDLIRHFLRGYVDGDGCLCITKGKVELNVLGTESFLTTFMSKLPLGRMYPIYKRHKDSESDFCTFNLWTSTAYKIIKYLYENSSIYLDRKYEKYKEICRLYEESYKELGTKIGEGCDADPEINIESNDSISS